MCLTVIHPQYAAAATTTTTTMSMSTTARDASASSAAKRQRVTSSSSSSTIATATAATATSVSAPVSARDAASAASGGSALGSPRCCYRSKQCNNTRALKPNGEFHQLCEYHRRRANLNQQRVHQRRKFRLKQSKALLASSSSLSASSSPSPSPSSSLLSLSLSASTPSSPSPRSSEATDGLYSGATVSFAAAATSSLADRTWTVLEPFTSPCGDLPVYDLIILEALLFSPSSSPLSLSSPASSVSSAHDEVFAEAQTQARTRAQAQAEAEELLWSGRTVPIYTSGMTRNRQQSERASEWQR